MQTPICDAFSGRPIHLGDKLRSIERGDTVRVVEIGQEWCGGPTIRLEPVRGDARTAPYKGRLADRGDGSYAVEMYTLD